jgi:hypothetical protein
MGQSFKLARADASTVATVVGVGTVVGAAAAITEGVNRLTSETGQTAFILPARQSAPIVVRGGTVAALVFPPTGGIINALTADASFSVTAAKVCVFYPVPGSEIDYIAHLGA